MEGNGSSLHICKISIRESQYFLPENFLLLPNLVFLIVGHQPFPTPVLPQNKEFVHLTTEFLPAPIVVGLNPLSSLNLLFRSSIAEFAMTCFLEAVLHLNFGISGY